MDFRSDFPGRLAPARSPAGAAELQALAGMADVWRLPVHIGVGLYLRLGWFHERKSPHAGLYSLYLVRQPAGRGLYLSHLPGFKLEMEENCHSTTINIF